MTEHVSVEVVPIAGEPAPLSAASLLRHGLVVVAPVAGTVAAGSLWLAGIAVPEMADFLLLGVFYVLNILGMELAYHRYFAHRAFQAPRFVELGLAVLGSLAYVGPIIWWVAIHRLHHKNADHAGDPHSPWSPEHPGAPRRLLHAHVGWLFDARCTRPKHWGKFALDLYQDPVLFKIHMMYDYWLVLGLALPAVIGAIVHGSVTGALLGLLWGGTVRVFLATNAIWSVNSVGHSLGGRRPYATRDRSRNSFWLAIVTLGAGWHNNHHAFPSYAVTTLRWWQVDVTGLIVRMLRVVRLVTEVQLPRTATVAAMRKKSLPTPDVS
jgi:stearoyl-CoA desaturase (Delta-9 desaturase)